MTPSLYVAYDDKLVIVARLPVGVVGGRGITFRWGGVLEVTPAREPADPAPVAGTLYGLGAVLILIGAALLLTGYPVGGLTTLLGLAAVAGGWACTWWQRAGVLSAPRLDSDRDQHHVLVEDADRQVFAEAVDLCRRSSRAWPALGALVDVPVAERQLAQALFDLAGALERRQELRELRTELGGHAGAPELAPRLARATAALAGLDDEVSRRLATLTAVAVAGEEFLRDEEIGELARTADETIARLTSARPSAGPDAGSELAERTEAVLRAYRELS
ncbi:hypothetical protein [Actinoplanes sp. M2I2]|uniref:hypothetical protein n=1 Tax=Actinoplanes sp. M2I2 TaxID=1734444 RepID=UPI0020210310|nr:hypothetical protein [Actinoplanes sp. M2I2]